MTTKTVTLEDVQEPLFHHRRMKASPLEAIVSQPSSHSPLRMDGLTSLDLEDYQVALVPFQTSRNRLNSDSLQSLNQNKLLVLLTWAEFVTRVRRELGLSSSVNERGKNIVTFGQVHVDLLSMEARRCDRSVSLTAMEFKVLRFFVTNPNRVIPRDEMLDQVWGYENYPCTRTVDNHVLRLRQKLELDFAHPIHFRTVHGVGYKFTP